jgi:Cft2 family RNA processing exonuclease
LPYLFKNEKLKETKVYATTPVAKLGIYMLLDAFISKIEMTDKFNLISDNEIISCFLNLNEVKFKENIKLPQDIVLMSLPSGYSLGGCCWKINYKLHSILYAPQFSINFRYTCDPFPYEILKDINILITDIKSNPKIPVVRTIIENEFKKNILEDIERKKSILIPSDSANINLEILIRLEKILDEFYMNKNKEIKESSGVGVDLKKDLQYKVLVCGYLSNEIVESIKSLIEFLGSTISQQFYSYNENPFNLQYVQCVKDVKEYHEIKKNNNVIVIASFESLEAGIAYKLLPDILTDSNYRVYVTNKSHKNSMLRKILKKVKDGVKIFHYEEIKRIIDIPSNIDKLYIKNENIKSAENLSPLINLPISIEHQNDLSIKKKLFAKSPYQMFSYHQKKKLNEYGIVFIL